MRRAGNKQDIIELVEEIEECKRLEKHWKQCRRESEKELEEIGVRTSYHVIERRENQEMAKIFDDKGVLYIPIPYCDEEGKAELLLLKSKLTDELVREAYQEKL